MTASRPTASSMDAARSWQMTNLRGLACVLLVLYHVIGADPISGLTIADGPIRLFNDALATVRMPLFTFLSGMAYGLKPFSGGSRRFLKGKVRRLMVPLLVVGTLFAVMQANIPGAHTVTQDWSRLHLNPVAHYWHLESIMWIFVLTWLLDKYQLIQTPGAMALVWITSTAIYLSPWGTHWLAIGGEIYLLPYFLVGLSVSRFDLWRPVGRRAVQGLLLLATALALWELGMPVPEMDRRTMAMLVAGVALCLLLLVTPLNSQWLARVGRQSYSVFLFHVFFTAAIRMTLNRLQMQHVWVHMALGLLGGLVGPMLIDTWASRYRWPALLLLGKTWRPPTPAPIHPATPT